MPTAGGGGRDTLGDLSRRHWWIAAAAVIVVAAIVLIRAWTGTNGIAFVVIDADTGAVLVERDVAPGQRLTIEHVHSVTGRLVREQLVIRDDGRLGMVSLWFDRHGANLPTGPEEIDGIVTTYRELGDGSVEVLHHARPLPGVPLIVGSETVDHTIVFHDGQRLRLLDVAPRWTAIELTIRASR